jgi:alpha-glucosidase
MSTYSFVNVDNFTPTSGWNPVGPISSCQQQGNQFVMKTAQGGLTLILTFLSPTCFRIRFNPNPNADFSAANDVSYAVINRNLGAVTLSVNQTAGQLTVSTGAIVVNVGLNPYFLTVTRPGQSGGPAQLIHSDNPGQGLIYLPGKEVVANLKQAPAGALYFGLGEKAGSRLTKNNFSFTQFNFDNFTYANPFSDNSNPVPSAPGPLNPAEPLYNSTPFLIEVNSNPVGPFAGVPYAYGIYFDSVAQSYFNLNVDVNGAQIYYFGALYGFMDYYFMAGNTAPEVVAQFTQLTGAPQMPPKYVFGYHQGCYGYYDRNKLAQAANSFRAARIPIDGLHIDVDFQNNYRTFTSSEVKFPNPKEFFADLKTIGFKCSTNITSLITANPLDENGATGTAYPTRDQGLASASFLFDTRDGQPASPQLFLGNEGYGNNQGTNPYSYPPILPINGTSALGSYGYYPDLGDPNVRTWWGDQYAYILSIGIEMIWQDMTCPALEPGWALPVQVALPGGQVGTRINDAKANEKTFPLDLMLMDRTGARLADARIHNGYVMNLLDATSKGLAKLRPTLRTFIIARGGFAGTQRYGGLWTGDSASSWDFLNINIPEVLNIGLSGQPISGCDIGGFAAGSGSEGPFSVVDGVGSGQITNYELFTRWMTMGALLPWYRNHYDGYAKGFQEPYAYGEPVPANCREWIEIRYRLIQVFYDAMYQASLTGLPIARALFLNDPQDANVYQNTAGCLDTEFFLGHDILVAPILQPRSQGNWTRNIYLPGSSGWYAFQNDEHPLPPVVKGGQTISNYYAPLDQDPLNIVPVYVRAGAIVPMRQLEQWVGQLPQCPLTFNIYPGPASTYQLYQDDGVSTDSQTKNSYRLTEISQTPATGANRVQTVEVKRTFDQFQPAETFYYFGLLATPSPLSVTANGQVLAIIQASSDEASADQLAASAVNACYYNASLQTTFVKIFDVNPDVVVVATFSW